VWGTLFRDCGWRSGRKKKGDGKMNEKEQRKDSRAKINMKRILGRTIALGAIFIVVGMAIHSYGIFEFFKLWAVVFSALVAAVVLFRLLCG